MRGRMTTKTIPRKLRAAADPPQRGMVGSKASWWTRSEGCLVAWWAAWLLMLFATCSAALDPKNANAMLQEAEDIKLKNPALFASILDQLEEDAPGLTTDEAEHLRFLQGWKSAYEGHDSQAARLLTALVHDTRDPSLQVRARVTLVSILLFEGRYEEAFEQMSRIRATLPQVADGDVREQALMVAADLYSDVGRYDLALEEAQAVIAQNWAGRGRCEGMQVRLHALYDSNDYHALESELQAAIDSCNKVGEETYAEEIRTDVARMLLERRRYDAAIAMLRRHYAEELRAGYSRQIAWLDALLARAYEAKGRLARARRFALRATRTAVRAEHGQPLETAYWVLYEVAKQQGHYKAALAYHEQYAAVDKEYLNNMSARLLAYYKITEENIASKLKVDALGRQNRVLQLQKQLQQRLSEQEVEASRLQNRLLMVASGSLAVIVILITVWAYRTKRLQMHFKTLSQTDYLTGICNRLHFMEQAGSLLEYSSKSEQEVSIVLFDVDHFKLVNDRYGHAAGDSVLKRLVASCRDKLRQSDIFSRFGGEEFAILLPGCPLEQGRKHAELLREAIAAITAVEGAQGGTVSASFGVASTSTSGYDLDQLLAHADKALYQAKQDGRNRVVVYSGTPRAGPVPGPPPTTQLPAGGVGFTSPRLVRPPLSWRPRGGQGYAEGTA